MGWVRGRGAGVLTLGLDGVPVGLLRRLIDQGVMPNLAAFLRAGSLHQMATTLPASSSVAWASFVAGCQPGRHGVYGLTDLRPDSYDVSFTSSSELRAPALWDRAAMSGRRSLAVNVPGTYPARKLRGTMVAGFVAPDLRRACHPPVLADRLTADGYRIDVDARRMPDDPEGFSSDLLGTLAARCRAILALVAEERWDLAVAVVTETDRLHHFFYDRWERSEPQALELFERVYRTVDDLVGRLLSSVAEGTRVMVLSDHGFCSVRAHVYLNAWLAEHGYLRASSVAAVDRETRAFALDAGRVYLNTTDQFPAGAFAMSDPDYEDLLAKLAQGLGSIVDPDSGEPVVAQVHRRRDIYSGPQKRRGPHLVAVPRPGYELKGMMGRPMLGPSGPFTGTHTAADAFLALDRPVDPARSPDGPLTILDAAATALRLLGADVADLDGRALL